MFGGKKEEEEEVQADQIEGDCCGSGEPIECHYRMQMI